MEKRPRLIRSAKFFLPPGKPLQGRAIAIRFYSSNFFESLVPDISSRRVERCGRFTTSPRGPRYLLNTVTNVDDRTELVSVWFFFGGKKDARGQRLDRFDDNGGMEIGAAFKVEQRRKKRDRNGKRMMEFCERESFFEDRFENTAIEMFRNSRQLFVFPRNERKEKMGEI